MANAFIDANSRQTLTALSSVDGVTIVDLYADPITHRLYVDLPVNGTVTSISVVTANGFAGTVATATSTPAITLTTTVTGLLKGNGTAVSAATAGTDYVTPTGTTTLTNKRITKRIVTVNAPGATPTTNTDNCDIAAFTGLGAAITSMTTNLSGTPSAGDLLMFQFTDDGTGRALTFGASFAATTVALPTTTVSSTLLRVLFQWNGSVWQCIATC